MPAGRSILGAVIAVALAIAASGCANPPGTDGDLLNQWPAIGAPQGWVPEAATCHTAFKETQTRVTYAPLPCTESHAYETIHVGLFTGADAAPPARESESFRAIWSDCDTKASEYLGGPWRERKVWIGVSLPPRAAWQAGMKWYQCQMAAVEELAGAHATRKATLKGQFGLADIQFGCFQVADDGNYEAKPCTEPHNAEFAGVFAWDSTFDAMIAEMDKEEDQLHVQCQKVVHTFAGGTVRTGTWTWVPVEPDWEVGDNSIRCYLYFEGLTVSQSLKGVGTAGWPLTG